MPCLGRRGGKMCMALRCLRYCFMVRFGLVVDTYVPTGREDLFPSSAMSFPPSVLAVLRARFARQRLRRRNKNQKTARTIRMNSMARTVTSSAMITLDESIRLWALQVLKCEHLTEVSISVTHSETSRPDNVGADLPALSVIDCAALMLLAPWCSWWLS